MSDNALGWVSVPFVPVFDGITQRIEKGMVKPMTAGSKKAADAVQKTADDMVKSLERQAAASKKKVDSLGKAAEDAAGKEEVARRKVQAAIAKQKAAEEDYQKALAKGESGSKELAKLEDAKAKVTEATIKAKKAEQDSTDAQKKAKDQAEDYAKTVGKLEDAQKSAKDEEDRHKGVLGGLRKEMDKAKASADEAGTSFHDIGSKLKSGMAVASGAVAGGLAGLVKVGTTFDNTWDTVRAGTGATGEAFEALKENIRNVAKESVGVGGDFEAIGSTAADLNTRLGLTGKPLEDMTRSMMQLQELGVDADINSLSQALNGFGVEAEDMPGMLDKMFQVSQATGLSVSELANSAVKAGPSLRGFGFDMADSAALVGQMDKAGLDADKTLQSMQRALAEFSSEERDAPEALKETIGSIEELINAGDEAAAIDMASNIFGTRGAAQFVDAVKTGTLSVDDFMAATGATSDTINGVAEETADFAEKWDQFKLNALAALEPVASKIFDSIAPAMQLVIDKVMPLAASFAEQLGPVLEDVVGKLTTLGEWILKNKDYLVPLLAAVGTAIGLWKAWTLGMTAVTTALKLAKAAQEGMNLAMKANVIGIVVTAIAALVAGLVWFFTKTETGRELWEKFTGALVDGWQWVSEKFSEVWGWIQDNVLNPMVDFFQTVLWPAIQSVISWIGDKWNWLSDTLSTVVNWIYDNVIMFYVDALKMLWDNVQQVISWIGDKWQWMSDRLSGVWNWIYQNVILRAIDGYKNLWQNFLDVVTWISEKWDWMGDQLHKGWQWIDQNVFSPLKSGLDTVQEWFRKGVDGIGRIWDGLRAAAAKPVKFVIDTVWNNGILKAWNAIADFLPGIDTVNKIDLGQLGGYAQGGVLPGYTPGRDVHDFYSPTGGVIHLSGGEAIMRPEWTRAVGGEKTVARMNAMAKAGKLDKDLMAIGMSHGTLGAFANGGVIGAMANIVRAKYPMLQLTSGYRPGDSGMHGAGLASDWSNGHGNTPQQLALAHDIARTYPGSAELIYDSPGWSGNIKNGQNVGAFGSFYTMAQAGPHHHHVHWAMTTAPNIQFGGGVFEGGSNGGPGGPGGGGFFNWITDKAKGIWSDMVDPLKRRIEDIREDSKFWDTPFGFLETIKEKAWSFLSSKFGSGGGVNNGSVDTSDVSGAVAEQVETVFARHGFTGADWEAAKWIIGKESGWNPTATNPSSGAYGLFQFNPMGGNTLASYLPDRNPDPAVQADAGARYIKDRYGSPTAAKAFWEQNGWYADGGIVDLMKLYDQGGWLPHGGMALNLSGGPEPVLNPDQWKLVAEMIRSGASMGDVARELGRLVPALKQQTEAFARFADNAQAWMAKAGDYNSIEGINARQGVRRMLDLGLDLPGTDVIKTVLDGEEALWDSRARAAKNLDTIVEKEKAWEDARKAVADLSSKPEGVSEDDQKKIDKAQKILDEAKAKQAEADSDEKRAKAADKVADAEEKLKEIREEVDKNSEENAKKHAEEVTKANEAVSKAEQELAAARKQQAMDLDNVVLMSQGQIKGLIPQVEGLASKLIGMGAPAAAVQAGLGGVVGALGKVASFAGPAGITLGVAMEALKVGIKIVTTVVKAIVELVEKIRKARLEAVKTLAEGWAVIAEYANLVVDLQSKVTSLQQALIRGANAQREAEYNLALAQHDRYIAEADGALRVAEARLALDEEIRRGAVAAQLKLLGLHEDWDSYMAYQALEAQGVLKEWSDSAISALFTYEKARAEALKGEVTARLEQIKAEAALAEAQRQNVRNQQDLLVAQERLIRMSAKVAGVDLVEATGTAQVAKLMAEMAEVKQAMDKNVLGRWGVGLGANGSYANEYRGQQAQYESLQRALDAVLEETGVKIDRGNLDRTLKLMGRAAFREGDAMAVLRAQMPELVQAETALRVNEALKPVQEARDQQTDLARQVEDFTAEIGLYEKTTPLERTLKGLDYTIQSLEQASAAFADGNEKLRGEYLASARANHAAAQAAGVDWKLDSKYATPGVRDQVTKEVTIHMEGDRTYTADEIDALLKEVTAGSNVTYKWDKSSTKVAASRRKERI